MQIAASAQQLRVKQQVQFLLLQGWAPGVIEEVHETFAWVRYGSWGNLFAVDFSEIEIEED